MLTLPLRFMVAVAYIDPGNYATDVAAGADSRFGLLFMVLLSNLIAIFFQVRKCNREKINKTLTWCRLCASKWVP